MVTRKQNNNNARISLSLNIDRYNFYRVEQFMYPRTILTKNNGTVKEIEARIQVGNKFFFKLSKLLKIRSLSRDLKKQTTKYNLDTTFCYAIWYRDWSIRKTDKNKLLVFLKENSEKNCWSYKRDRVKDKKKPESEIEYRRNLQK